MRASVFATLLFIGLLGLGIRAAMAPHGGPPAALADERPVIVSQDKSQDKREVKTSKGAPPKKERPPLWKDTVTGEYKRSSPEAVDSALQAAAYQLSKHLQSKTPPVEWTPTAEFVRKHMLRGTPQEETKTIDEPNAPLMYRSTIDVEMSSDTLQRLIEEDRRHRVEGRMEWLAKGIGGLVLILIAVAGYIRLDDMTKGFYTIPLRVAAITLGIVGAGLLWWIV